jgi:peptidyl-prolyl cis-trans isomerase D
MLQSIREGAKGWIAWVIVIIICIPFAFWGINEYFSPAPKRVIAEVNGVELSERDFQQEVAERKQRIRAMFNNPGIDLSFMDTPEFRNRVLQDMIEEELLVQAAIDSGLRIGDAFLATRIQSFEAFQEDGQFSPSQYEQVLQYQGMTPSGFEWEIRRALLTDQIREGVLRSALVTDYDQQQRTRLDEQQRSINYLIIPRDRFDDTVTMTDADLEKYYQEHLDQYKTAEKVRIEYAELSKSDLAEAKPLSEETLKQHYQERKASFTTPGRWKARHILIEVDKEASVSDKEEAKQKAQDILTKIGNGESFETLAKQFSDDIGSKNQGGDLGWFGSGTMVKPFEEALKSMKVGGISEPVKTRYGFHIIELVDVEAEKVQSFEQVREQLETDLKTEQAESEFYGQVEQMANLAFENPDNLDMLIETLNLERKTTDWFDKTGGRQTDDSDSILSHSKVIEIAFSDEVLKERFNSEPIEIDEQHVVVLRIKEHQPAKAKPIDDVKDEIKSALKRERTQAEAEKLGSDLLDQIKLKGEANVVKEQALNWSTEQWVKREDSTPQRAIIEQAFKMGQPSENKAIYQGLTLNNGDYALIAVLDIKDGVVEETKTDTEDKDKADPKQQEKQQQQQAFGESEFNYFISGLKVDAEIKDYSKKLSEDI